MRSSTSVSPSIATPPLRAVERHRVGVGHQVHPAAHPLAVGLEVLSALGRADAAQLGVDRGAVVALLVVLGDDLPVRLELVGVRRDGDEVLGTVVGDDLFESGGVLLERPALTAGVDEHPAVPLHDVQLDQPELRLVESLEVTEAAGGVAQRAVELVVPAVVRADDRSLVDRHAARDELMATMAADVREGAQRVVLPAHQQHAAGAGLDRGLGAGLREPLPATQAHPPGEDVGLLPVVDRRVDVGAAGQHPRSPEGGVRRRHLVGGERGDGATQLIEHAVNPRVRRS